MLESLEGNLFREPDPVLSEDVGRAPTDCNDCGAEPGLSHLQGSGCGQLGDAITAGFAVSYGRLLSTPAEGSGKHQLSRKKKSEKNR